MYSEHTKASILALASVDPCVTAREREILSGILSGRKGGDEIVKYWEAAKRLNLSLATVKRLVKAGRLHAVNGTGSRACGIEAGSIDRFCA